MSNYYTQRCLGIIVLATFWLFQTLGGSDTNAILVIKASNRLDISRNSETIEINIRDILEKSSSVNLEHLIVNDQLGHRLIHQLLDIDLDGIYDQLIFQADFGPKQLKTFVITSVFDSVSQWESKVYARFVPTRQDDFAWENDRIAYRMYGPALEVSGEISSGVDVWVKRTHELIIDKWYQPDYNYHSDSGDGLDYYKVGSSRGCGGSAIWDGSQLYPSNNFTSWKIFANGPIRAIFELGYQPWKIGDMTVSEVKRITIDAGHNLNRFESRFQFLNSNSDLVNCIGLVKREGSGRVESNLSTGWLGYWEPTHKQHGSTGCGLIIQPDNIQVIEEVEDHNLIITRMLSEHLSYYAGAGWEKSTDFSSSDEWFTYIEEFALRLQSPLVLTFE